MLMLLAILILIAMIFGACLTWIVAAVADAKIEIGQAATAIVMTLIATFFLVFVLKYAIEAPPWIVTVSNFFLSWVILAALVVSYAKVSWKHGFIISAIYAVAQATAIFAVGTLAAAATTV